MKKTPFKKTKGGATMKSTVITEKDAPKIRWAYYNALWRARKVKSEQAKKRLTQKAEFYKKLLDLLYI